jgi:hypothetical protein
MNCDRPNYRVAVVFIFIAIIVLSTVSVIAKIQTSGTRSGNRDVTILVTAHPHNDRAREIAAKLQPEEFTVLEEKQKQRIITVKRASEAPPIIAVVIQDDLVSRVSNEISGIRDFIRRLPEGSRVMTAYITAGTLRVAQDFTTDRTCAAESLRIVAGSRSAAPYSPCVQVVEALKRFDAQGAGRRIAFSNGLSHIAAQMLA